MVPPASGCSQFNSTNHLSRRGLLQAGTLGVLGLGLADALQPTAAAESGKGTAKACIVLFMWGGPSHLDTWDPKPDAMSEVRGPFRTIATTTPGLRISEHFPRLAKQAHQYALIRSMTHNDPAHLSTVHHILTGRLAPRPNSDQDPPSRFDSPHIGSIVAKMKPGSGPLPGFITLPWIVSHPAAPGGVAPGQSGGWMGQTHDPFLVTGDPNHPQFRVGGLAETGDVSYQRLNGRHALLQHLDAKSTDTSGYDTMQQKAFGLLSSQEAETAFDLSKEPVAMRDRYGRHTHGQCCLLARRMIEAGTKLVCVNWPNDGHTFWDTHGNNFESLKTRLMPPADQGFSALLEDLDQRGMLDETLVVWVGEFGRAPRISAASAGREHWPRCYSAVLAGGGVRGGIVYGSSDKIGAYPADNPTSPADLVATIYTALGIPPDTTVLDRLGRQLTLTDGTPIRAILS